MGSVVVRHVATAENFSSLLDLIGFMWDGYCNSMFRARPWRFASRAVDPDRVYRAGKNLEHRNILAGVPHSNMLAYCGQERIGPCFRAEAVCMD